MWTALADLARDIAGDLPEQAFADWTDPAKRTDALAATILEPFRRVGTVTASDTSGLSRMASQLPLAVVLKRIGEPKTRIHAVGAGLGGYGIGRWVADNTEMLFPQHVSVDAIVRAMCRIHDSGPVRVGFCIHTGTFYEIGGGLYGPDADRVEVLAEDHTRGGDTLLTPECRAALSDPSIFTFEERHEGHLGTVFNAVTDAEGPVPTGSPRYPEPYDAGMHDLLDALDEASPEATIAEIDRRYRGRRTVILAHRHQRRPVLDRMQTVDALLADVQFQQLLIPVLKASTDHWTVGGALALAAFETSADALACAREMRAAALRDGILLTVGIDRGDVYLFPMAEGRHEFAGDPVNRASKMAEDLAAPGDLCLSDRAAAGLDIPDAQSITWKISGIEIEARRIPHR
ncbi:MAG: hypothetical protein H6737_12435 [Alphaproteobacteria bacterium]|nr:hypothetical protein [Alphaproteobacteria bacterium]